MTTILCDCGHSCEAEDVCGDEETMCPKCDAEHYEWGRQCADDEDLQRKLREQAREWDDRMAAADEARDRRDER